MASAASATRWAGGRSLRERGFGTAKPRRPHRRMMLAACSAPEKEGPVDRAQVPPRKVALIGPPRPDGVSRRDPVICADPTASVATTLGSDLWLPPTLHLAPTPWLSPLASVTSATRWRPSPRPHGCRRPYISRRPMASADPVICADLRRRHGYRQAPCGSPRGSGRGAGHGGGRARRALGSARAMTPDRRSQGPTAPMTVRLPRSRRRSGATCTDPTHGCCRP